MLAVRIIPTLLYRGATLVKGERFEGWRSVGHVQQAARIHATRGVDELVVLDIGATPDKRGPNIDLVRQITAHSFTPVTVGGGISTTSHVEALLGAGADKVAIKTAWQASPRFLSILAERYGCQAVVAAIDYRTGEEAVAAHWAMRAEQMGAGEIMLTAMDKEGTLQGYDVALIAAVAKARTIPVIAHGGCGTYEHMAQAIRAGASAVAAGAMFQFTDQTPRGAAQYLAERGFEVRI